MWSGPGPAEPGMEVGDTGVLGAGRTPVYGDQQGQLRLQGKVGGVPGSGMKLRTGVEAGGTVT